MPQIVFPLPIFLLVFLSHHNNRGGTLPLKPDAPGRCFVARWSGHPLVGLAGGHRGGQERRLGIGHKDCQRHQDRRAPKRRTLEGSLGPFGHHFLFVVFLLFSGFGHQPVLRLLCMGTFWGKSNTPVRHLVGQSTQEV